MLLAGAGAVLLALAEFSTLYDIRVAGELPDGGSQTSGAHHGYALLVVAVAVVPMALGAGRRGSRPAALALLALGAIALFIALAVDLPVVRDEGLIGETYDAAVARPRAGYYLESLGAVILLVAGMGLLLFGGRRVEAAPAGGAIPAAEG